jgi:ABC-2 type transport system permease protein
MNAKQLWNQRVNRFLQDIRPYLFYALQSLSFASIVIVLLFSYLYGQFLDSLSADFPRLLLACLVLTPVLAVSPIRTYLQPPDTIYLLPLETELADYFRAAQRKAFTTQLFGVAVAWFIAWPLIRVTGTGISASFLLGLLLMLVLKRLLLHGRWLELHIAESSQRKVWAGVRWVAAALLSYAVLKLPLYAGVLAAGGGGLLYLLALSTARRAYQLLPWLHLFERERHHRAVIYRLLNLFIDVPEVNGRARSRTAPRRLSAWFGYRPERAYLYLYTLVWFRSEAFGLWLRLTLVGTALTAVGGPGIAGYLLWGLFAVVTAVQLGELQRTYRYSERSYLYPLPEEQREHSARTVRLALHLLSLLLLTIVLTLGSAQYVISAGLLVGGGLLSLAYHYKQAPQK